MQPVDQVHTSKRLTPASSFCVAVSKRGILADQTFCHILQILRVPVRLLGLAEAYLERYWEGPYYLPYDPRTGRYTKGAIGPF
jgi:hypothetical protein